MKLPRLRLTVPWLMAVVVLSGLAVLIVDRPVNLSGLTPNLLSTPWAGIPEIVLRLLAFGFGPLLGVVWQRNRGGRGVLGGVVTGAAIYGAYILLMIHFQPALDPFSFGTTGDFIIFSCTGAVNGLIMGVAAWVLAALVRRLDPEIRR